MCHLTIRCPCDTPRSYYSLHRSTFSFHHRTPQAMADAWPLDAMCHLTSRCQVTYEEAIPHRSFSPVSTRNPLTMAACLTFSALYKKDYHSDPNKLFIQCSSSELPCPESLGYVQGKTLGSGTYAKVKAAWSPFENCLVSYSEIASFMYVAS